MIQYMHYVIYITVLTLMALGIYNTIGCTGSYHASVQGDGDWSMQQHNQ